jgi:hypothetical protein
MDRTSEAVMDAVPVWRKSIRDQWLGIALVNAIVMGLALYRQQGVLALLFGAAVWGSILSARGWNR